MVEAFGDQLLARAALADHKDGPVERRGAACPLDGVEEGVALSDELFGPFHVPTVGGESHHLARIFGLVSLAKLRFFSLFAISGKMARLLYS